MVQLQSRIMLFKLGKTGDGENCHSAGILFIPLESGGIMPWPQFSQLLSVSEIGHTSS